MNTTEFNILSDKILTYIKNGIVGEELISNLIYENFSYSDIAKALNTLVADGKISAKYWNSNAKERESTYIPNSLKYKSVKDTISPKQKNLVKYSKFKIWYVSHKNVIKWILISLLLVSILATSLFVFYFNTPQQRLKRAFYNTFGSKSFSYEIDIKGVKSINNSTSNNFSQKYVENIIGSLVTESLKTGLIADIKYLNNDGLLTGEKRIKVIILGSKGNRNCLMVDKYDVDSIKSAFSKDMYKVWLCDKRISMIKNVFPELGFDDILNIADRITDMSANNVQNIISVLKNGNFLSSVKKMGLKNNTKEISFSINNNSNLINSRWVNNADFSGKIKNGFLTEVDISSVTSGGVGNSGIKEVSIKFSNFNNRFDIVAPNKYINMERIH